MKQKKQSKPQKNETINSDANNTTIEFKNIQEFRRHTAAALKAKDVERLKLLGTDNRFLYPNI